MTVKAYGIPDLSPASAGPKPEPLPYERPHYSLRELEFQSAVWANEFSKYKYRRDVVETPGRWWRIVLVPPSKIPGEPSRHDHLRKDGRKFTHIMVADPGLTRPADARVPQQAYWATDLATREIVWHMTQEMPPEADWPERWTAIGISRSRQVYIVRNYASQLGLI